MWLLHLKKYAYLILSGSLVVMAFLSRIFFLNAEKHKKSAEEYKAKAHHATVVIEDDIKTEMDHESRSAEIAHEIKENGHTDELSNPNEW